MNNALFTILYVINAVPIAKKLLSIFLLRITIESNLILHSVTYKLTNFTLFSFAIFLT